MKLFDILPDKLFTVLTGKNKNVFVVALLTLYTLVNTNDAVIKKDDFVRFLKDKATEEIDSFSIEEEVDFEKTDEGINTSSKASMIVRRLEETGWIEIDIDNETLDEIIILPNFSIKFLTFLFEVINESTEQYSSLVHTTYSELKLEDDTRDEFMYATLLRAFENTKKLKVDLITLSHSIRVYQSRLNKIFTSNEVLHSYFDNYKELVSDRIYHPLKTFDSVERFKRPIINILMGWLKDEETRKNLVRQGLIYSKTSTTPADVEKEIISKINYISDMYETMNGLIDRIDTSHRDYTKASTNKILFFNNNDRSVKACIEAVIVGLAQYKDDRKVMKELLSGMQNSINFYENGFINSDSITLPIYRKSFIDQTPLEILNGSDAGDYLMQNFIDSLEGMFTDEKIYEFMEQAFGDRNEIKSSEIPLVNDDAFILLILGTVKYNNSDCFYTVNFESKEKIHSYGYLIPDLTFTRKEEK